MSGWVVRKRASALLRGDRFIFSEDLGGEGETVTVEYAADAWGNVEVRTEELDFIMELNSNTMVTMSTEEE